MRNSFRDGSLRPAITHFFNEDLAASRAFLDAHLAAHPDDALAHALAAAVAFYGSLVGSMLAGGGAARRQPLDVDGERRDMIMDSLARAERLAQPALGDRHAADMGLFALSLASGVRRDYGGFVLNRWKEALKHAQEVNLLGRRLLKANPDAHDAYCIFASSEYLMSRVPDMWRPLAKIPGISGDRAKAIRFCEVGSRSGRYYQEFAMCLLVALYTDDGRPADAVRVLAALADRFPGNSIVAAQLQRRAAGAGHAGAAAPTRHKLSEGVR